MPTAVEQIEPNGATVIDFDPPQVPFAEQESLVHDALLSRGWTVEFLGGVDKVPDPQAD